MAGCYGSMCFDNQYGEDPQALASFYSGKPQASGGMFSSGPGDSLSANFGGGDGKILNSIYGGGGGGGGSFDSVLGRLTRDPAQGLYDMISQQNMQPGSFYAQAPSGMQSYGGNYRTSGGMNFGGYGGGYGGGMGMMGNPYMGQRPMGGVLGPGQSGGFQQQQQPDAFGAFLNNAALQSQNANAANEKRYQDIMSGFNNIMTSMQGSNESMMRGFDERAKASQGQLDAALNQSAADTQSIQKFYGDRYNRGLANLEGAGDTERADINQRYDQLLARNRQRMISSGLGNSTVGDALDRSVTRDVTREHGALNERLNQQRLNVDAGLSGDSLQALQAGANQGYNIRSQMASNQAGLQGDTLQAQQAANNNVYNMGQNMLGFMERRNDVGPDMGQIAGLAAQYGQSAQAARNAQMLAQQRLRGYF